MPRDWQKIVAECAHTLAKPALQWTDGHVLGNGDVGAVVWGVPERVCVGLSKHDVWNRETPLAHGPRWGMAYPEILRRFREGEREVLWQVGNEGGNTPTQVIPLACGTLELGLLRGQPEVGLAQTLSLLEGECRVCVQPTPWGRNWGARFAEVVMTCFAAEGSNAVVVRLESDLPQRVPWSLTRTRPEYLPAPEYRAEEGAEGLIAGLVHPLPVGEEYAVALVGEGLEVKGEASRYGVSGEVVFGEGEAAVLYLGVASSREVGAGGTWQAAVEIARSAREAGWEALREEHRRWWHGFWAKSGVDYPERQVQQLWHMGLYALGSSTRPDKSPPHLQGIWNQWDIPPWHADFHFNVNVQESHWAACPANHPELQAAFVRCLTRDWREEFRRYAREQFEAPGLAVPFNTDMAGRALGGWPLASELSPTAWAAQHVWWQYRATGEEGFLREEAYPFLRECAEFYRALLERGEDGRWHVPLSQSPEQCWPDEQGQLQIVFGSDPAIDLALIRELFENLAQAAAVLGEAEELVESCREIAANLTPLPVRDGVLIDSEVGFFPQGDRPGFFPWCHRHPSRLAAIFPCEQIGLHSDAETLELGRRSFREFRSYGEEGFTGWSLSFQACLAARLGCGEEAEDIMRQLAEDFSLEGLLSSHNLIKDPAQGPLFQAEALLGVPAALTEMLLQSTGGELRLFPAVPEGKPAAFHGLRAPGGILVEAAQEETGVTEAAVWTERETEVRLVNPYPGEAVVRRGGEEVLRSAERMLVWGGEARARYEISGYQRRNEG